MKRIFWLAAGAMAAAACAAGQGGVPPDQMKLDKMKQDLEQVLAQAKVMGPEKLVFSAAVPGAPYSGEEVNQFSQTLADGTHIQREDRTTVYRDSKGRVRRETPTSVTITDPVAGLAYVLDPKNLTARKLKFAITASGDGKEGQVRMAVRHAEGAGAGPELFFVQRLEMGSQKNIGFATESKPDFFATREGAATGHSESLGSQSIDGVLSEGTRITETIPLNAIGNDRPIQTITERWYSPELKTMVMTRRSDPRAGEEIFRLTNIRRGEPNPDLFQPPPGYQIIGN